MREFYNFIASFFRQSPAPFSEFPMIGKKSLFTIRSSYVEKKLSFENHDKTYYTRIYNDSRKRSLNLVEENVFQTTFEVLPANYFRKYNKESEVDSIFHVSKMGSFGDLTFKVSNKNEKSNDKTYILNDNNRFISFLGKAGDRIKIDSPDGVIVTPPIPIKQNIKQKRRLTLLLFVDGLVDRSVLGFDDLRDLMPNTSNFFNNDFDFRNHYVNSEWTLTSMASIFSSRYTQNHGIFDPKKLKTLGNSFEILTEYFKKNYYLLFLKSI